MAGKNKAQWQFELDDKQMNKVLDAIAQGFDKVAKASDQASDEVEKSGQAADQASVGWQKFMRFADAEGIKRLGEGLRNLARAGVELVRGIDQQVSGISEARRVVEQWSGAVGATVTEMENLNRVGLLAGFDQAEDVGDLIQELGDRMTEAAKGNEDYANTFKALGVDVLDANGKMRDQADVFVEVSDRLGGMKDQALAMSLAGDLMTDIGRKWIGVVRAQGGSLTDLLGSMDAYGHLTAEQAQAIAKFEAATNQLHLTESRLAEVMAGEVSPALAEWKVKLAEAQIKLIETNPQLATFLELSKQSVGPIADATVAVLGIASALKILIGTTAGAKAGLLSLLKSAVTPLGLAIVAVTGFVLALTIEFAKLRSEADSVITKSKDFNSRLDELQEKGYYSADAVSTLRIEIEKLPRAMDYFTVALYEQFQAISTWFSKFSPLVHLLAKLEGKSVKEYVAEGYAAAEPGSVRAARDRLKYKEDKDAQALPSMARRKQSAVAATPGTKDPTVGDLVGDSGTKSTKDSAARKVAEDVGKTFADTVIKSVGDRFDEYGTKSCAYAISKMLENAGAISGIYPRSFDGTADGVIDSLSEAVASKPWRFEKLAPGTRIGPDDKAVRFAPSSSAPSGRHAQAIVGNRVYGTQVTKDRTGTTFEQQGSGYTKVRKGDIVYRLKANAGESPSERVASVAESEAARIAQEAENARLEAEAAQEALDDKLKEIDDSIAILQALESNARSRGDNGLAEQYRLQAADTAYERAGLTPDSTDDVLASLAQEQTAYEVAAAAEERRRKAKEDGIRKDVDLAKGQLDKLELLQASEEDQAKATDAVVASLQRWHDWLLLTGDAAGALRTELQILTLTQDKHQKLTLGQEVLASGTSTSAVEDFLKTQYNLTGDTILGTPDAAQAAKDLVGNTASAIDGMFGSGELEATGKELNDRFKAAVATILRTMLST